MCLWISIHALVKRATIDKVTPHTLFYNFNPRPRKEGDAVAHTGTVSDVDFNPRPRKEGDDKIFEEFSIFEISIHALVKRATRPHLGKLVINLISIHALVKRATR